MKNRDKRIKSNKSSINDSQKDVFFETFDEIKENENRDNEDTLTVEPYRNKVVSKIIPSRPILVDCFLNNGILITTYFDEDIILKELKMIVLEKAKKMPLFTQLLDVDQYSLKSINIRFNFVTPVDENVTLKSLNLIYPFFEFNAKKPVLATYSKLQLNILMHDVKVDMDTTGNTFENYCFMAKAARSGKLIQDHINSSNYNIVKYLYPPQYTLSTKLAPEIIESLYSGYLN
ncbi:hypothetical protein A3Q56_03614 [Intoshia linei]|uniref:PI3K-ABD domain-containing protein n=1 Tax=Intoshia linei TaxID=1819745 RepID=A0A177B4U0_9BILA|nr:hypothetical protein A3Q56_03614 [Intoshia linei]